MNIRKYSHSDCKEMMELFCETVHSVNSPDYTKPQLDAWADGHPDLEAMDRRFSESLTLISEENGIIAGFGNIDKTGYLDMLYTHRAFQRKGIASAICSLLESSGKFEKITVHASITAKPFFEKRGYSAVKKQDVIRCGITLTNYIMEKNPHLQTPVL